MNGAWGALGAAAVLAAAGTAHRSRQAGSRADSETLVERLRALGDPARNPNAAEAASPHGGRALRLTPEQEYIVAKMRRVDPEEAVALERVFMGTETRSLSIQGHVIPIENLQYILENEGFTADDAYYDEMARIMNGFVFPLRVYRGLAVQPGDVVRKADLRAGSGWWTWNREVAVHFARGTHNGSEAHGDPWMVTGIVPSPEDVHWWNDDNYPSSIEQYLRFSSPYVEARFTDDSLLLRAITRVTVRRLA